MQLSFQTTAYKLAIRLQLNFSGPVIVAECEWLFTKTFVDIQSFSVENHFTHGQIRRLERVPNLGVTRHREELLLFAHRGGMLAGGSLIDRRQFLPCPVTVFAVGNQLQVLAKVNGGVLVLATLDQYQSQQELELG